MNTDPTPPVGGNSVDDTRYPMTIGDGVSPFSLRTEDMLPDERRFDPIGAHIQAAADELVRRTAEQLTRDLSGRSEPTEYHDTEPMAVLYRMGIRRRAGWDYGAGRVTVHIDRAPRPEHRGPDGMRISLGREDGTELFPHDLRIRRLLHIAERARWRHNHMCRRLLDSVAHWTEGSTQIGPGFTFTEHTDGHHPWSEADREGYYTALRVLQRGVHAHRAANRSLGHRHVRAGHPDGAPLPEQPISMGHGDVEELARIARAATHIAAHSVRSTEHRRNEGLERELRNAGAKLVQQKCRVHDLAKVLRDARRVLVRAKSREFINGLLEKLDQDRIKDALDEVASLKEALKVSRQMHGEYVDRLVVQHSAELRRRDINCILWLSAMAVANAVGVGIAYLLGVL